MTEKEKPAVKVKFSQERIEDTVTVEEFVGCLAGNFGAMVKVISKMVVDDKGEYITPDEGGKAIMTVTIKELKKLTDGIAKELRDALVNPTRGGI